MTETMTTRQTRMRTLIAEHGCATDCEYLTDQEFDEPLGRWALMEADEGSADNGGPWWSVDDDWRELLHASDSSEAPDDWPATKLFDLDSDWSSDVHANRASVPEATPPGEAQSRAYISNANVITVAELREVLSNADDPAQRVTLADLGTGDETPIVAAMVDDDNRALFVYVGVM